MTPYNANEKAIQILLLGGFGQVGYELQRALAPLGNITTLTRDSHKELCGDLCEREALAFTVRQLTPDIIVNAAGFTGVDLAETEPEQAAAVNTIAARVLAAEAKLSNALLVYYSTDYVFGGDGDRSYLEDDPKRPLNVYGRTKLEGEQAIKESGCRHLILRTSWVYASRRNNFMRTILDLATRRENLQIINDQFGAPTGAELIANTTFLALRQCLAEEQKEGLYHLAASGETTWFNYAQYIVRAARQAGWPIRLQDDAIEPVPSKAFPTPAKRPHNSRLDTTRLEETFGVRMPDWRDGVDRALNEIFSRATPQEEG